MNVINFIFRFFHIRNLLTLCVPTPFHSPCTPSIDYAHLSTNCENTFGDCIDLSHDYTLDDLVNTIVNSANMPDISFLDLYIPNPTILQLLLFYRSKIQIMFTIGSMIYSLFPTFFICGFCISHLSSSSFVLEVTS
jgi:hypothetical protein